MTLERTMATLTATMLAMLAGSGAEAQVTEVRLRVNGVACPFCAYNMEKRIKKVEGVPIRSKIDTYLDTGVTVTPWSPEKVFDPAAVRQAIRESGFTLRSLSVTAKGALPRKAPAQTVGISLTAPTTGQVLQLAPSERADHRQAWDSLTTYAAGDGTGKIVEVQGVVVEEPATGSAGWRLAVQRWAPTECGAEVDMRIEGFACERCAARAMRVLAATPGVVHAEASHEQGMLRVWTTSSTPDLDALRARIAELGFQMTHAHVHQQGDQPHADEEENPTQGR